MEKISGHGRLPNTAHLVYVAAVLGDRNESLRMADVFQSVEYFPYLPAAGHYIGGTIW